MTTSLTSRPFGATTWRRVVLTAGFSAALIATSVSTAIPALAAPDKKTPTVSIIGAVGAPATYTRGALEALPQVTLPTTRHGHSGHSITGVSVESLVQSAAPTVSPSVKNGLLRVRVTAASGHGKEVTTTLGELDPGFGNHPALLVLAVDGRALKNVRFAFPGDTSSARTLRDVRTLSVAVATAPVPVPAATGDVIIHGPKRAVTLSAQTLQRLPSQTTTVTFLAGTSSQTHTEVGPALREVLLAAGIAPTDDVAVTAVGSDGYLATVTLGEAFWGGRTLLLSLNEDGAALAAPRLVTGGDVKGGRYVSGVVELDVVR